MTLPAIHGGLKQVLRFGARCLRTRWSSVRQLAYVFLATLVASVAAWSVAGSHDARAVKMVTSIRERLQGFAFSPSGSSIAAMLPFGVGVDVFTGDTRLATLPSLKMTVSPDIGFVDEHTLVTYPSASSATDTLLDVWTLGASTSVRSIPGNRSSLSFQRNQAAIFCISGDRRWVVAVGSTSIDQFLAVISTAGWATRYVDTDALILQKDFISSISCSQNGSNIVLGSIGGSVYIVDVHVLKVIAKFHAFVSDLLTGVGAIALHPSATMVATGPTIRATNTPLSASPDAGHILGTKIWRLADSSLIWSDADPSPVRQLAWSPNGQFLAIARDGGITIIDAGRRFATTQLETNGSSTVQFAPDGAVAFDDNASIRTLDLSRK